MVLEQSTDNNPFKVGDKVRVNRQGEKVWTIKKIEGNMVYGGPYGYNTPRAGVHHTKLTKD